MDGSSFDRPCEEVADHLNLFSFEATPANFLPKV